MLGNEGETPISIRRRKSELVSPLQGMAWVYLEEIYLGSYHPICQKGVY